jgi:VanZ family protein
MRVPLPLFPRWLRWLGVVAVGVAIFSLSVLTVPPEQPILEPPALVPLDKWRHFLAYTAFGWSLAYATTDWDWTPSRLAVLVFGVTVTYGVGIELLQAPLADRYFSVGDAYANALGGVLALSWFVVRRWLALVPVRKETLIRDD